MRLTKLSPSAWIPRLERILSSRQMNEFEKEVVILLVGLILLPHRFLQRGAGMYHCRGEPIDVATVLALLSPDLASQIANRKSFYKDSVLVRDHIIHVSTKGVHGDLSSCPVEIDRRMVDFIVGLDSEVHQLVDGSHLYLPQTKMESVVLPEETKTLITKTVQSLSLFKKSKQQFKLDETISSSGLVMLFYGDSGTGKTMTANAIANLLGKKLLLINFPSLGGEQAAGFIRMIFRESKINDAVLFFDECESIFESRDKSNQRDVNMLLTELERHDGMIILATNRPFDLDEAMHRRITLAIEFQKPDSWFAARSGGFVDSIRDHVLRKHIWSSLIPAALPLSGDVDLSALAMRYELSGGFIKNAILTALSIACSRAQETNQSGKPDICITQDDLARGAQLQLRGRLAMRSFERRIVPRSGLEVLATRTRLGGCDGEVIDFEKSKTVLYGQWGFGGRTAFSGGQPEIGSCVLFYGPPGTGKSLAAQAIGFEVGRALWLGSERILRFFGAKVRRMGAAWYVGETGKNIEKVFAEARSMEAILVFDEAEGLFGRRNAEAASSVDKHSNLDSGLLLYWLEHYPGLCILTTNARDAIDSAFFRRFRFMVEFPPPDRATRAQLWDASLPKLAPRSSDVDVQSLASERARSAGGGDERKAKQVGRTEELDHLDLGGGDGKRMDEVRI
ncbi:Cell division cycle protein 48 homolog AF_1297 [Durusdinium trenchii]|uniref:Cell division cycle protein 48 homolog AF_1297 n=1 Tax=Durusdinium trenchii TaxID=1381693 RepID=A0ABP0QR20_9DINO